MRQVHIQHEDPQHPDGREVEAEIFPGLAAHRFPFRVREVRTPTDFQPHCHSSPQKFSGLMEKIYHRASRIERARCRAADLCGSPTDRDQMRIDLAGKTCPAVRVRDHERLFKPPVRSESSLKRCRRLSRPVPRKQVSRPQPGKAAPPAISFSCFTGVSKAHEAAPGQPGKAVSSVHLASGSAGLILLRWRPPRVFWG